MIIHIFEEYVYHPKTVSKFHSKFDLPRAVRLLCGELTVFDHSTDRSWIKKRRRGQMERSGTTETL